MHVGILVDGQDDALLLRQLKNRLKRALEGCKGRLRADPAGVLEDILAQVLQILLCVTLDAHIIDGLLAVNEAVDERRLAYAAAPVKDDKLELAGAV